jgi:hypothetical protein
VQWSIFLHSMVGYLLNVLATEASKKKKKTLLSSRPNLPSNPSLPSLPFVSHASVGLKTATTIVKLVFISISPNFNAGYVLFCLQEFLIFSHPTTFADWFALDVLGWSAICFVAHAVGWYEQKHNKNKTKNKFLWQF